MRGGGRRFGSCRAIDETDGDEITGDCLGSFGKLIEAAFLKVVLLQWCRRLDLKKPGIECDWGEVFEPLTADGWMFFAQVCHHLAPLSVIEFRHGRVALVYILIYENSCFNDCITVS